MFSRLKIFTHFICVNDGSEVCNVCVQWNKKNNSCYFKFILININFLRIEFYGIVTWNCNTPQILSTEASHTYTNTHDTHTHKHANRKRQEPCTRTARILILITEEPAVVLLVCGDVGASHLASIRGQAIR